MLIGEFRAIILQILIQTINLPNKTLFKFSDSLILFLKHFQRFGFMLEYFWKNY